VLHDEKMRIKVASACLFHLPDICSFFTTVGFCPKSCGLIDSANLGFSGARTLTTSHTPLHVALHLSTRCNALTLKSGASGQPGRKRPMLSKWTVRWVGWRSHDSLSWSHAGPVIAPELSVVSGGADKSATDRRSLGCRNGVGGKQAKTPQRFMIFGGSCARGKFVVLYQNYPCLPSTQSVPSTRQ
jgi:hypothetical protein